MAVVIEPPAQGAPAGCSSTRLVLGARALALGCSRQEDGALPDLAGETGIGGGQQCSARHAWALHDQRPPLDLGLSSRYALSGAPVALEDDCERRIR
jgi:hypothetical protein